MVPLNSDEGREEEEKEVEEEDTPMVVEDVGHEVVLSANMDLVEDDVNGPILVTVSLLRFSLVTCSCLDKSAASEYCVSLFVRTLLLFGCADAEAL